VGAGRAKTNAHHNAGRGPAQKGGRPPWG